MLHALEIGDEELLGKFLFDEVHVPFRRRLVPGMEQAMQAGCEAGAAGVTISGHGPGLVALTTDEAAVEPISQAMIEAFAAEEQVVETLPLRAATRGACPQPTPKTDTSARACSRPDHSVSSAPPDGPLTQR